MSQIAISCFLCNPNDNDLERQPEEEVVNMATRLVILAKISGAINRLAFIWATVVLLGGLVSTITFHDFWVITILLVVGGIRVLFGTQEFEWQRILCANSDSGKTFSHGLHFFQYIISLFSLGLSLQRISVHDFAKSGEFSLHRNNALYIYYSLICIDIIAFVLHGIIRKFETAGRKLFKKVSEKCGLNNEKMVGMFFEYVYSSSLNSGFGGVGKDLVDFSMEKIQSSSYEDQLDGVQIMSALLKYNEGETRRNPIVVPKERRARKIGTTPHTLERLLDMITWMNPDLREIRKAALMVLKELVYLRIICFKIAAIAGGLEGIASVITRQSDESDPELKFLALKTLKTLAEEHRHCVKIGQTRGVVQALVSSINLDASEEENTEFRITRKCVQILKFLAKTTGESGKAIRGDIVKQVYALDIFHKMLLEDRYQDFSLDILQGLSQEKNIKDAIGNTGSVISSLVTLFTGTQSVKAGTILTRLAWHNARNCVRISSQGALTRIIQQLESNSCRANIQIPICASRLLRNLYAHLPDEDKKIIAHSSTIIIMQKIKEIIPTVQIEHREIAHNLRNELLEAYLGLAAYTISAFKETESGYKSTFRDMPKEMSSLLSKLRHPSLKLPRIRRHAVELVIELMKKNKDFHSYFKQNIRNDLEAMFDSL